jgi:hypothetical protein
MLAFVILTIMNVVTVAIFASYAAFLKDGHYEFGFGVIAGLLLFSAWYRIKNGHWPE